MGKMKKSYWYKFAILITAFVLVIIWHANTGYFRIEAAIDYNVTSTLNEHWAWNDLIGWIDFNFPGSNVVVNSVELRGSASSSWGPIYLNCLSHPNGCGSSDFKVFNDGVGRLSGYAWNDVIGWLSFSGSGIYKVLVESRNDPDTPPSDFENWAWSPVIGWVSFNCKDITWTSTTPNAYCNATSSYKVATDWYSSSTQGWLESAVFDTGVEEGAQFNSILWRGDYPDGTRVRFQFATSPNSDGPWVFVGQDGTQNSYFEPQTTSQESGADLFSAPLNYEIFNNNRYFRYKVILFSNSLQTISPVVKEVIVNWSP